MLEMEERRLSRRRSGQGMRMFQVAHTQSESSTGGGGGGSAADLRGAEEHRTRLQGLEEEERAPETTRCRLLVPVLTGFSRRKLPDDALTAPSPCLSLVAGKEGGGGTAQGWRLRRFSLRGGSDGEVAM